MTTSNRILAYLQTHYGWVSGMEIESKAYEWQSKRINRTLRDMSSGESPVIEKRYTNDKKHAVQYRLRQKFTPEHYIEKIKQEQPSFL